MPFFGTFFLIFGVFSGRFGFYFIFAFFSDVFPNFLGCFWVDLGKVCLPEATVYFETVEDYIDAGWFTDVVVDVKHSFFMISAGLTFTLILAYVY